MKTCVCRGPEIGMFPFLYTGQPEDSEKEGICHLKWGETNAVSWLLDQIQRWAERRETEEIMGAG